MPPDVGDGVALASWERFVGGPPPPAGQLAWIEAFARDAGRGPEDPALAALLLTFPAGDILDPAWLRMGAMEVYLHLDAPGFGSGRYYRAVRAWFEWLFEEEVIGELSLVHLLCELEHARRANGLEPEVMRLPAAFGVEARDRAASDVSTDSAAQLLETIVAFGGVPEEEPEHVKMAVQLASSWLACVDGVPARWGRLDPEAWEGGMREAMLATGGDPDTPSTMAFHAMQLRVWGKIFARFHGVLFLGDGAAEELAARCADLAVALEADVAA